MKLSRRPIRRRGFSLVELLVVLGIIILAVAAAVPAFRFITGSRSIDSSINLISAMVARARNQATVDHRGTGVFFFLDPLTDRTTMALVHQGGDKEADPDFVAYKGWTDGKVGAATNYSPRGDTAIPATSVQYVQANGAQEASFVQMLLGQGANALPPGQQEKFYGNTNAKASAQPYTCVANNTASFTTNRPSRNPPWGSGSQLYLDIVAGTDFERLPPGVACQTVNDQTQGAPTPVTAAVLAQRDRYLRTGAVLFDRDGHFMCANYDVVPTSSLGQALYLPGSQPGTTGRQTLAGINVNAAGTPTPPNQVGLNYFSQYGVVLYDRDMLKNATVVDVKYFPTLTFKPSEQDWMTSKPINGVLVSGKTNGAYNSPPASLQDEQRKEQWLDLNAVPLMVDRNTGALIRGE